MKNEKLRTDFLKTVTFLNNYNEPLPADVLLKLYAYFKIANKNFNSPDSKTPLINAFKANALIQAKDLSEKDAMKAYIALVKKEIIKKKQSLKIYLNLFFTPLLSCKNL